MPEAFGAPPPNAPKETAQPLSDALIQEQLAMARRNEGKVSPWAKGGEQTEYRKPQVSYTQPPVVKDDATLSAPPRNDDAWVIEFAEDLNLQGLPEAITSVPGPEDNWAQPRPAASDTDTPSRGIPKKVTDPGKVITGGFGDFLDQQYNPLDGFEMGKLVLAQLAAITSQIPNDLRFSMGVTYPRFKATVSVTVECFGDEGKNLVEIKKIVEKHSAALEVARKHADDIVFVVREEVIEMTPEGESVNPPDRVRHELGLPIPQKQRKEVVPGSHEFQYFDRS